MSGDGLCAGDPLQVMNHAPLTVTEACPLSRAWTVFTMSGLRHLVVTDENGTSEPGTHPDLTTPGTMAGTAYHTL